MQDCLGCVRLGSELRKCTRHLGGVGVGPSLGTAVGDCSGTGPAGHSTARYNTTRGMIAVLNAALRLL